jgi:hypothetical protein
LSAPVRENHGEVMKQLRKNNAGRRLYIALAAAVSLAACSDGIDQETQFQNEMKADLLKLAQAEADYFTENGEYTLQARDIVEATPGVFLSVQYVASNGWGAEASNPESRYHCGYYEGTTEASFLGRWAGIVRGQPLCKLLPQPVK